jgi:hypothetical protein
MKKNIITKTSPISHLCIFFDTEQKKFFEKIKHLGLKENMTHEVSKDHVLMKLSMEDIIDNDFIKIHHENINKFLPEASFC